MPLHIRSAAGEIYFTRTGWYKLLQLATSYGWQPAGTLPPEILSGNKGAITSWLHGDGWNGDYLLAAKQVVSADDAANLAEALTKALPDLPDHDAKNHLRDGRGGGIEKAAFEQLGLPEWFSGSNKTRLQEFIALCKAGGFVIG